MSYASKDIASAVIASRHGRCENKENPLVAAKSGGNTMFVDIGANVGWFMLVMAYGCYRVYAIEPYATNLAMLRHSLCITSPEVRAGVAVLPYGLAGTDGGTCELWQEQSLTRGACLLCVRPTMTRHTTWLAGETTQDGQG